jgi:hypothetical protein
VGCRLYHRDLDPSGPARRFFDRARSDFAQPLTQGNTVKKNSNNLDRIG